MIRGLRLALNATRWRSEVVHVSAPRIVRPQLDVQWLQQVPSCLTTRAHSAVLFLMLCSINFVERIGSRLHVFPLSSPTILTFAACFSSSSLHLSNTLHQCSQMQYYVYCLFASIDNFIGETLNSFTIMTFSTKVQASKCKFLKRGWYA